MGTPGRVETNLTAAEVDSIIAAAGSVSTSLRKLCGLLELVAWVGVLAGLWCVLFHTTLVSAVENIVVVCWRLAVILAVGACTSVVHRHEQQLKQEIRNAEAARLAAEAAAREGKASAEHGTCGSALSQLTKARISRLKQRSIAGSVTPGSSVATSVVVPARTPLALSPLNLLAANAAAAALEDDPLGGLESASAAGGHAAHDLAAARGASNISASKVAVGNGSVARSAAGPPLGTHAVAAAPIPEYSPLLRWWVDKVDTARWRALSYSDKTGDAAVYEDPTENVPFIKIITTMHLPAKHFLDFVLDNSPEALKVKLAMDGNILEMRDIEKCPGGAYSYTKFSFPWPLSNRDMVTQALRYDGLDGEGSTHITIADVEHPAAPEIRGNVRALSKAFYRVRTLKHDICTVEFYTQYDPMGSIPHAALTLFKTKTCHFFVQTRELLEGRYKQDLETVAKERKDQ